MNHPSHRRHMLALKRIEGQVRGLQRMIEEGRYCVDILTQIASVQAALRGVRLRIFETHLRHCVRDACAQGSVEERERKIGEVLALLQRVHRGGE